MIFNKSISRKLPGLCLTIILLCDIRQEMSAQELPYAMTARSRGFFGRVKKITDTYYSPASKYQDSGMKKNVIKLNTIEYFHDLSGKLISKKVTIEGYKSKGIEHFHYLYADTSRLMIITTHFEEDEDLKIETKADWKDSTTMHLVIIPSESTKIKEFHQYKDIGKPFRSRIERYENNILISETNKSYTYNNEGWPSNERIEEILIKPKKNLKQDRTYRFDYAMTDDYNNWLQVNCIQMKTQEWQYQIKRQIEYYEDWVVE